MKIFDHVTLTAPYLRVNNRNQAIDFYQETLGLKLLSEENALVFLGGHEAKQTRLTLEESPSYRTRATVGPKKLHALALRTAASDIAQLLARQVSVQQVFQGEQGYAFAALSPDGHAFMLHAEEDLKSLKKIDYPDLSADPDFVGLADVTVSRVVLNVPDLQQSKTFYADFPLPLTFVPSQGQDLQVDPDQTWDMESLEFQVSADTDLAALATHFADLGAETFLNKKETQLVVSDPSRIELWFLK